ncbi:DUF1653 domain-containing protein [Alicyclobacillus cycloheptanicus]|jgi:hypothetical protein|uniref:DUF1653 domain-containing protein n=1 Tax=Alicyclobacillus cycloheptanicus TaxID=1457 RepID=A0ABT9XEY0_9BACL|nr:DUF1653 domain-containing protein [Alicyclobacillus cycloheptanicus]MDQ0188860.1 hypothetical protein [Alicyclobacillus cycloheptanicus]WDM00496.1 DUF1653 domain-containing protein [Alicyclobacillus cycloheptanicus]
MKYRHFKGAVYEVIGEALHSETEERLVLYRRVGSEQIWARPYDMFHGIHESGVKRFVAFDASEDEED